VFGRFSDWRIAAGFLLRPLSVGRSLVASDRRDLAATTATTNQLVDAHVRSLLPNHLLDVVSTDRHTVKPWFAARQTSPRPSSDLTDKGFPLIGGHSITSTVIPLQYSSMVVACTPSIVFVWRTGASETRDGSFEVRGHSLLHWSNGGLSYWAVSDAAEPELEAFKDAYTQ